MKKQKGKIAVGLSGGVDSSVTAALLKEDGYDVVGITMAIFDGNTAIAERGKHACYGPDEQEDIESAAAVCEKLHIPFHVIDLKREYRLHVLYYFKKEYLAGRTPNPCIVCNHRLKFGFLLEKAKALGIDFNIFATGHYAQIETVNGRTYLKKAKDDSKDQSYFLYALTPDQLRHIRFPLGHLMKQETRKLANQFGLQTADRIESQDFIAGGDYASLFEIHEIKPGDIVDVSGKIIGEHRGIIHYTLGQRQGLGVAAEKPLYVLEIDAANNRIVAGEKKLLFSRGFIASDLNLFAVDKLDQPFDVTVKIRLNHKAVKGTVHPHEKDKIKFLFDTPEMAVTPGQSAVMYQQDLVFGGGIIEEIIN